MTSHSPTLQGNYGETDAPDSRVVFVLIIFRKKYIMILLKNSLRSEISGFEPRQSARGEHINTTVICKPMCNEVAGQILKSQQKRGFLTVS